MLFNVSIVFIGFIFLHEKRDRKLIGRSRLLIGRAWGWCFKHSAERTNRDARGWSRTTGARHLRAWSRSRAGFRANRSSRWLTGSGRERNRVIGKRRIARGHVNGIGGSRRSRKCVGQTGRGSNSQAIGIFAEWWSKSRVGAWAVTREVNGVDRTGIPGRVDGRRPRAARETRRSVGSTWVEACKRQGPAWVAPPTQGQIGGHKGQRVTRTRREKG